MEVDVIVQVISTLGFPIFTSIALFWLLYKSNQERKQDNEQITQAITNSTLAVNELSHLVRELRKDYEERN